MDYVLYYKLTKSLVPDYPCRKPYSKWTMFSTRHEGENAGFDLYVVNLILNGLCSLQIRRRNHECINYSRKPYSKWTMFST